jgi:hypothetical protein
MARFSKRDDLVVHHQDPFNAEPPREVLAAWPPTASDAFCSAAAGRPRTIR